MSRRKKQSLFSRLLILGSLVFCLMLFSTGTAQHFFMSGVEKGSAVSQSSPNTKAKPVTPARNEEPTPILEGVMTDRQRKHSKIFKGFKDATGGRKLKDLIGNRSEMLVEMPLGDVQAPRGLDLRRYLGAYFKKVTCGASAIVIVTVSGKSSQLVDDGTFTFTDYEVTADEIFKNNPSNPISKSSSFTVTRPGGSVKLNGRVFRTKDHNNEPLQVGHRYLLFLRFISDTGSYQAIDDSALEDSFEINGEQLDQVSAKALPFGGARRSDALPFLSQLRSTIPITCN